MSECQYSQSGLHDWKEDVAVDKPRPILVCRECFEWRERVVDPMAPFLGPIDATIRLDIEAVGGIFSVNNPSPQAGITFWVNGVDAYRLEDDLRTLTRVDPVLTPPDLALTRVTDEDVDDQC